MTKITSDIPTPYTVYNGAYLASYTPKPLDEPAVRLDIHGNEPMFSERPTSHFKLALFACFCCFTPAGITALVYACRSRSAKRRGDMQVAAEQGKNAKDLSIVAITLGIFFILLGALLGAVFYLTYVHVHVHDHDHDHDHDVTTATP
ncbi:trafficking regulator of GLUT4 1-like [Haliotis cracherodii]|uniref:trafficking regulator of GLUT4 1-like n=1 Tax=Haliotis cracherodii TaxID=6455 RepID=UPI0039EBD487